ncbi:hypothetical protein Cgig2_028875 [Carnegiea gigantea]|uniref:Uncharacterized protein n=1 Tax=Carnegiea gigantea TaxID=171969 RepID=A0A9Q1KSC4_9CARY|nr:hypothetical protein Cgig2_028875 [Carnegiea gigantea]
MASLPIPFCAYPDIRADQETKSGSGLSSSSFRAYTKARHLEYKLTKWFRRPRDLVSQQRDKCSEKGMDMENAGKRLLFSAKFMKESWEDEIGEERERAVFEWPVTKNAVVHYKDRMITIVDVNLDMYQVIDLFRNVRGLAMEQGVVLPKYAGFKWHPPGRKNQRWPLNTDNDWVILDGLQKAKEKETMQFTSPSEPTLDPSLTEVRMWADNLIVTPSSIYIDPNTAVQVQPMSKGTPHALKKPSTSGRQKL